MDIKKNKFKGSLAVIFVFTSILFSVFPVNCQETIKLSIGAGHQKAGLSYVVAADDFFLPEISKRVEERTNYRIKWTTAYAASVAQLSEVFEAVTNGLLDFGLLGFPFEATRLFIHNIGYFVPFGSPDSLIANRAAWQLFNEFPIFQEIFNENNQTLLCIAPTGNYNLTSTFPVNKFNDMKGKKIGSARANLPWLKGTGAIPVQSNFNDSYTSLASGIYDGFLCYDAPAYGFKMFEVAPYKIKINYGALSINGISVNNNTWQRLPKEVREIILEVAEEYIDVSAKINSKMEEDALNAMIAEGYKVIDIPKEEIVRYTNSLPEIPNIRAQELNSKGYLGSEIISRFIEILEESGHEFPRQWIVE